MKVTINKLASKRLLEAFAKIGACRTEEQAEGSVPLYKLAALAKDALPTLAVGVVTYNNHMQPSIN